MMLGEDVVNIGFGFDIFCCHYFCLYGGPEDVDFLKDFRAVFVFLSL